MQHNKMNSKENKWKHSVLWVVVRTNLVSPHYHIFSHLVGVRVFAFTQYKNTEKRQTYSNSGIVDSWLNRACPHHWWVCSHQNCNRGHPGMTWKGITPILVSYVLHTDARANCLRLTALPQSNCGDKGSLHRSFHLNYPPQNPITGHYPWSCTAKNMKTTSHRLWTRTCKCTSPKPIWILRAYTNSIRVDVKHPPKKICEPKCGRVFNLCLHGGLGWWFGSPGSHQFMNL